MSKQIAPEDYFKRTLSDKQASPQIQERRTAFANQIMARYAATNQEYADLAAINEEVNAEFLARHSPHLSETQREEILRQCRYNMHGALRIPNEATYQKLGIFLRDFFKMEPIDFYSFLDLGKDSLPVIASALKSPNQESTQLFYSLFYPSEMENRELYEKYTSGNVFSPELQGLIDQFYQNSLTKEGEDLLISKMVDDFMQDQFPALDLAVAAIKDLSALPENLAQLSAQTTKLYQTFQEQRAQQIAKNLDKIAQKDVASLKDFELEKALQAYQESALALVNLTTEFLLSQGVEPKYLENFIEQKDYNEVKAFSAYAADLLARRGGVCFNHATPTAFDIEESRRRMQEKYRVIDMQGPVPEEYGAVVQLQQFSNQALDKPLFLRNGNQIVKTSHKPMFVEFEKRGFALTPKGKASNPAEIKEKDHLQLMQENYVHYQYRLADHTKLESLELKQDEDLLQTLENSGIILRTPSLYAGFLSKSARGIFASTGNESRGAAKAEASRDQELPALDLVGKLLKRDSEKYNPIIPQDALYEATKVNSAIFVLDEVLKQTQNDAVKSACEAYKKGLLQELGKMVLENPAMLNLELSATNQLDLEAMGIKREEPRPISRSNSLSSKPLQQDRAFVALL